MPISTCAFGLVNENTTLPLAQGIHEASKTMHSQLHAAVWLEILVQIQWEQVSDDSSGAAYST